MKVLADVLVRVCVRELQTARSAGKEKARAPLTQANGLKTLEQLHDKPNSGKVHRLSQWQFDN